MQSPYSFIVKPIKGKRYNNTKNVSGIELIISTSKEDSNFSNRQAKVIELPLGYKGPIQVGDILLVHHNVFKYYNDMKGKERSGKSFFKDDLFFIEADQYFAYKQNGQWNAVDRYCFVEPVSVEDSYIYKPISEEPLVGLIKYPNKYLLSQGLNKGDKVSFQPHSEYEFNIDGEKLYRMYDHQITLKL
tara:strand:- start:4826 stop:5389 length:564 start_codon:yes stop_codon:yes gene_type:complete